MFGMGPTLRGFNEQLSKLRGTIFLLVTGYFGLSSRMKENGSVVVTMYLADGKLSRHRATEPDTMIVFEGTADRTVEVLPLKTEAAFYCVFAVGTYHTAVPEDISSQLKDEWGFVSKTYRLRGLCAWSGSNILHDTLLL